MAGGVQSEALFNSFTVTEWNVALGCALETICVFSKDTGVGVTLEVRFPLLLLGLQSFFQIKIGINLHKVYIQSKMTYCDVKFTLLIW